MYKVFYKKSVLKQIAKLELSVKKHYTHFFSNILPENPFVGKLSENTYHAHVKYHWVAVWTVEKGSETIIVTYAGSREDAPY